MTPERFRDLWTFAEGGRTHAPLREALTAFVESEAMREKAEFEKEHRVIEIEVGTAKAGWSKCEVCQIPDKRHGWTDAEWTKASWEKWLGREP